jgi:undecaprenyl-phosphate 4-deoxy-4-formamido-L-arabinose transferase
MQLSIIVPVYNSARCVSELVCRVAEDVGSYFSSYELILINDCSPDASWEMISKAARERDFVTGVNLRKNVGQDNAIMAGLNIAKGDVVVIMDDDLQHDPADIRLLYERIKDGFDVAFARFDQKEQAAWKNLGSLFNDYCARFILGKPKRVYMSPFKALKREMVAEIVKYRGPYPYVDGLIFTITSRIGEIPAKHHPRFAGKSNYNLFRSIAVWLKLATGFSTIPLRIVAFLGGVLSVVSFLLGAYFVVEAVLLEREPPGWPSVITTILFIGGIQLVALGTIGEYVGRMFTTQNERPQFCIQEICRSSAQGERTVAATSTAEFTRELAPELMGPELMGMERK